MGSQNEIDKKKKLGTYNEISCIYCEKNKVIDFTEINIVKLPCGHDYHYTCWMNYLCTNIREKSMKSIKIKCLECNSVLPNWELVC